MNTFRPVKRIIMASVMMVPLALAGCFFWCWRPQRQGGGRSK